MVQNPFQKGKHVRKKEMKEDGKEERKNKRKKIFLSLRVILFDLIMK
jgi:hypothetical protein